MNPRKGPNLDPKSDPILSPFWAGACRESAILAKIGVPTLGRGPQIWPIWGPEPGSGPKMGALSEGPILGYFTRTLVWTRSEQAQI